MSRRTVSWLSALVLSIWAATLSAQAPGKLALVGGMLLDGYEVPPLHHAAIVIEGNEIVEVGRAAQVTIPPDARVIDTRGRVMMPGLIDLHVHLIILGHGNYARWMPWIEENDYAERAMVISAKQLLMAGVTSAVDLGAPLEESLRVRDRIRRGEIPGPRMWMSGPWISRPGGGGPSLAWQGKIETPEDAARAVETLAEAGVDLIKAHSGLTPRDYDAIVEAAHARNLKVHAHLYKPQDVRAALDAGVDVLTHVGSAGTPPYEPELLRDIVVSGRPVVPTGAHRVWVYPATVDFPERLQDPRLREDFPPELYEEVQASFENFHTLPYFAPFGLLGLGTTDRQMRFGDASLKQWIDSGAVVGMGTDSGTPMNFHTESMWREIKPFVDLGMSPQRAISAATRVSARILGRGDDLGTIEPGKLADIIVLDGNPLFDIMALSKVEVVIKDGVVYKGDSAAPRRVSRADDGRY